MAFEININGLKYKINKLITLEQLISFLKCNRTGIAIEHNYLIAQQKMWSKILIKSDDHIEIVTIVGGG
jgi:thiamine biosynthesis protein ThiS